MNTLSTTAIKQCIITARQGTQTPSMGAAANKADVELQAPQDALTVAETACTEKDVQIAKLEGIVRNKKYQAAQNRQREHDREWNKNVR
jgi:hypothetical protein